MIRFTREGRDHVCHAEQWLPAPPEVLYPFYSDCRHMNHVLPTWVRFHILDQDPRPLAPGVTYDYRLRLHGVPLRWRTLVTEVDAPRRFVDIQARGPYAAFSHEHRFEPQGGGTLTIDRVVYRPPGGPLAGLINALMVRRDLRRLFEHRHAVMEELYADGHDPVCLLDGVGQAA